MILRSALHGAGWRAAASWSIRLGLLFALAQITWAHAQPTGEAGTSGWTDAQIRASRIAPVDASTWPDRPRWHADPAQPVVVVEAGDEHLSLIDGERLETLQRLPLRAGVQGAPRFSPDGRFAYTATRDGWISRHDLWNLALVAEVRAGLALRDLAISRDGQWLMAATDSPRSLVLLDAQLHLVRRWAIANREGTASSHIAAVIDAPARQSFVVALQGLPELWEISYNPQAEDFYDGLVHDFRMGEGVPTRGFQNPRRIAIPAPLSSLLFEPTLAQVAGVSRAADASASVDLINLDARRRVGSLRLPGRPLVHAGALFTSNGHPVLAVPNLDRAAVDVIDLRTWRLLKSIPLPGPAWFVRSHPDSAFAWLASIDGDLAGLTAIDRQTLAPASQMRAAALRDAAFNADGSRLWVSLGGPDAAVVVFDARTLKEIKRRPLSALPASTAAPARSACKNLAF